MTTPVHSTKTTGSRGELKAQVIFADIGWAPPVKLSEDIGTDLMTFARDNAAPEEKENAWDLGAPVFMQVKASLTEYSRPASKRQGEPGWWFEESDTYHFDHWLSFGLPYLLVLVDVISQIAYWAEVNGDAIVSTGKGRKIFVPLSQTVDRTNSDALTQIAVSRRGYSLEGAVQRGLLNDLAPADRLRTALMIPRLIVPRRDGTTNQVPFESAVAMIMRNKYSELAYRAREGQCPNVADWETHKDWSWRFAHALREFVTTGTSSRFAELAKNARHRFERDACLIAQACEAYINGRMQHAVDLLQPSRASKPADRGWILVQKAALLFELDKTAESIECARKALVSTKALNGDLTVNAIRGAAATILYSASEFGDSIFENAGIAQDHAGNWWRAQDVSWALEKDLNHRFKEWTTRTTGHSENSAALDDLAAAACTAIFSGDWNSWRQLAALRSQLIFTTTAISNQTLTALDSLVFIGNSEAARGAAGMMWLNGPLSALHSLVNELAYRPWHKRAEGATMAVLSKGGDLLETQAADHVAERILNLIAHDGTIRVHGGAWTARWSEIGNSLARVLIAASIKTHRKIADSIIADFGTCDDLTALAYLQWAHALSLTKLGIARVNGLYVAAAKRSDHYRIDLLEIVAPVCAAAKQELRREAMGGNARAIRSLLVVGSTERNDFLAFGRGAAVSVQSMIEDARGKNGVISMKGYVNDQLDDLVLAALNTNDTKLWKEVTGALEACVIEETQQQRAVRRLASQYPRLPRHVQRKLRKLAPTLSGRSFTRFFGDRNEFAAATTHLRIAAGLVPDIEVEAMLLGERRADPVGFVRTLEAWNSEHKLAFLATMVVDESPAVRAQAGFSLLEHARQYASDQDRVYAIVQSALLQEDGCALVDGLAQSLSRNPAEKLIKLETMLRGHRSGLVRRRFSSKI